MATSHRWKHSAVTAAALLAAGLHWSDVAALTLGQIRVDSHLGEPLRATIPVTNLSADEAQSLRANPASPDVFNAHGANYTAIMTQLRVTLQQHADGTASLQLTTAAPVNEPFLDLVLNTSWNGGNVVRSYAVLLDPPTSRPAVAPISPAQAEPAPAYAPIAQAAPAPAPIAPPPAAAVAAPRATPPAASGDVYQRAVEWMRGQGQSVSGPITPAPRPAPSSSSPAAAPLVSTGSIAPAARPAAAPATGTGSVTTRRGDTAGAIARRNLPANVSLDQMLLALQRANPHAFIQDNVNLLRSGVALTIPDAATAQSISAQEARQLVAAQTRDFGQYRSRVARTVPAAPVAPQASDTTVGAVTAPPVAPPPSTGDELVLSNQQAEEARLAEETRIAEEKQRLEDEARQREAEENTRRMQALLDEAKRAAANGTGAAASAGTDSGGLITVEGASPLPVPPAPAAATASDAEPLTSELSADDPASDAGEETPDALADEAVAAAAATAPALEAVPVQAPVAAPPPPVEPPPPPPAPVPPPPPVASGFLADNPYLPLAGGALALLLLGYGYYRYRKGRGEPDVVYENSGNIPDSFFNTDARGGEGAKLEDQSTRGASTGISTGVSSMSYSPSQIDATGEGDPVLEADVLLAYGRDQQAEEVLKEAEINNPTRAAIKVRLAEIYASRQDKLAFEAKANEIARLTQQSGADWVKIAEIGRNMDPGNPLYQASAQPSQFDSGIAGDSSIISGFGPLSGLDFDFQQSSLSPSSLQPDSRSGPSSAAAPLTDLGLELNLGDIDAAKAGANSSRAGLPLEFDSVDTPPAAPRKIGHPGDPFDVTANGDLQSDATPTASDALEGSFDFHTQPHDDLDLDPLSELPTDIAQSAPTTHDDVTRTLELDLSNLDLDLPEQSPLARNTLATGDSTLASLNLLDEASDDPLATKLALAKEFQALGDDEGARALADEVLKQADGELKQKARDLLDSLG